MTSTRPSVSVIVPVYNGANFLPEAVESILAQRYHPLEVIIVDDGSTDDTAKVALTMGEEIRYVHQCNGGPAVARNTGLKMARGETIGFLDADDLWPNGKLHIQLARLSEDPTLDVVMGRIQYIKMPGAPDFEIRFEGPENTVALVHLGSGLFKKSVFNKVGLFDESLRHAEDHDWFLRARELDASITILEEVTLYYRVHAQNMSHNENPRRKDMFRALKKSLDRRRKQGIGQIRNWFDFDEAKVRKELIKNAHDDVV